ELAGVAGRNQTTGQRRPDAADAFLGGALARAFVLAAGDLSRAQAAHRIGHTHGDGDGGDFVVELARGLRSTGLLLAGGAVFVHDVAADAVALGHLLGGLQHAPIDLGLPGEQRRILDHVHVHFLLDTGDALHAAGDEGGAFSGDDALRRQGDGLQARRTETVHRHAADADRATGHQRDLARDVHAGGAFGVGAA